MNSSNRLSRIAHLPPAAGLLGILPAGRHVIMDIRQIDSEHFVAEIIDPKFIQEVSVFLLPGVSLPNGKGLAIYWSLEPYTNWSPLGTLDPNRPSVSFRPNWKEFDELNSTSIIQIGISLEPLATIANVQSAVEVKEFDKLKYAELVANNLFNFLASFSQQTPQGERMVISTQHLQLWLEKFKAKFQRDPSFLYGTSGSCTS